MKKFWNSIKPIVYGYTAQYIMIFILAIIYFIINKDINLLNDNNFLSKFTIVCTMISMIPISIYLYRKYKIKESKIDIKNYY